MDCENKTVLDFNEYQDIDLREFRKWFDNKFFSKLLLANKGEDAFNYFNGKYDVEWWFHEDTDNNQFSIELKLVDVTDHPEDPELDKLIEESLSNINTNSVDVNKITKELNINEIPKKDRRDQVRFTKTYY